MCVQTYLCSDSSCMNAWSASTARENDIIKINSCLHKQQNKKIQDVSAYDVMYQTGENIELSLP